MKKERKMQRYIMARTINEYARHHVGKARQSLDETADDVVSGNRDHYAQDTVETGMEDAGTAAGSAMQQTAVRSYAKYRAYQNQRLERLSKTSVSYDGERGSARKVLVSENPISREDIKSKLKMRQLRNQAVTRYMNEGKAAKKSIGRSHRPGRLIKRTALGTRSKAAEKAASILRKIIGKVVHAAASVLIAAGPVVAIVLIAVLFAGVAAAIFGSPMGILFSEQANEPGTFSISDIVRETNQDFGEEINRLAEAHPECSSIDIQYEYEAGHTWASYWPEVLSVFAVDANLNIEQNVFVIDQGKKQQLQDTFWLMHQIKSEVETVETELEVQDSENDLDDEEEETHTEIVTTHTLHISVSSKTVDQLAEEFHFNNHQLSVMNEMLSARMRPYLEMLAGTSAETSRLQWPLPGYRQITTRFGEPDAFGNPGHKGIDIPAPEGTPICAAHSGTVLVASASDSYGNQILLDSGDGISTRYAHLSGFAVTAGQTVSEGQILGYVGSTGASTGNHLHFEVMINGTLINPMTVVSAR